MDDKVHCDYLIVKDGFGKYMVRNITTVIHVGHYKLGFDNPQLVLGPPWLEEEPDSAQGDYGVDVNHVTSGTEIDVEKHT